MSQQGKIRLEDIMLQFKIWLETKDGEGILGDGKWKILKAIEETGSLTGACHKLDLTYRRTWGDLKKIEQILGIPLLEKVRGGKEGGASQLTPQGEKLVEAFDCFHQEVKAPISNAFNNFRQKLLDIDS